MDEERYDEHGNVKLAQPLDLFDSITLTIAIILILVLAYSATTFVGFLFSLIACV